MTVYQVIEWDVHFENAKSRGYDECSFVCMPNKQHGLGFKRIWSQPDGPALFGCWCALIQNLSRQRKPRRGYLTDTGRAPAGYCAAGENPGNPVSPDDLAFMWGCDVALVVRMLEFVSSPKVGWIKILQNPDTRRIPDGYQTDTISAHGTLNERKKEEKEENERAPVPPAETALDGDPNPNPSIGDAERWRYEQTLPWAQGLKAAGAKVGPNSWPQWKALVGKHGTPAVLAAIAGLDPETRWADATEKALKQLGGQVSSSAAAIAAKRRKLQ